MALSPLEQIRAKLEAMEGKSNNNAPSQSDNALYPHWNIEDGQSATVRFLPDEDPDNVLFWVERQMIKLPFPGVKGGEENKPVTVQVPCAEMYDDTCPVLAEVRPWFKANDPTLEEMGRKYWKKRSYIFQGFVVEDPLKEDNPPENPIRRFVMSPQIFKVIKAALMDPDMENLPTDYVNGTDFRINKTMNGKYADYNMSNWARRERALSEEELAAIDEHGLHDLKQFLPARPTAEHYEVIAEMFEASVNGDLYDPEQWGNFYRPYGVEVPATARQPGVQKTSEPAASKPAKPEMPENEVVKEHDVPSTAKDTAPAEDSEVPWEEPEKTETPAAEEKTEAGKKSADDILAMIRKRNS